MESRTFGKTGLRVPVIGMGTWQRYDVRDPGEVQPVTDAILAHGATFVDTSPMYGSAERVLAKTLGPECIAGSPQALSDRQRYAESRATPPRPRTPTPHPP